MTNMIINFKNAGYINPAILKDVQFSYYMHWTPLAAVILRPKRIDKGVYEYTNKFGVTYTMRKEDEMSEADAEYYNSPDCKFIKLWELMSLNPNWK